jgi:hypothetical protein
MTELNNLRAHDAQRYRDERNQLRNQLEHAGHAVAAITALNHALNGDQNSSAELPALLNQALGRPIAVTCRYGHTVQIHPTGRLNRDTEQPPARFIAPPAVRDAAEHWADREQCDCKNVLHHGGNQ